MSKFTPDIIFETDFEGDRVRAVLRPLSRKSMIQLSPMLPSDESDVSPQFMDAAIDAVAEHVVEFSGLTDSRGAPIEFRTVCESAYFFKLLANMVAFMLDASNLREEDVGNLDGPRSTSSAAPETSEEKSLRV